MYKLSTIVRLIIADFSQIMVTNKDECVTVKVSAFLPLGRPNANIMTRVLLTTSSLRTFIAIGVEALPLDLLESALTSRMFYTGMYTPLILTR
jgi:hypothetical protein